MTFRRMTALGAVLAMLATVVSISAPAGAQATETCNGKQATIVGTDGDDRIEGTEGNDVIWGGSGKDVIFGRGGNDTICGGPGNDVIKGGRGNDYVEGNQGNDKLVGGIGRDTMSGGSARDKLFGGGGPDTLAGDSKRDFVNGQNGTDTCDLDALDRFALCEAGDVIGVNGTGSGTFDLNVPASFSAATRQLGGLAALANQRFHFIVRVEADGPTNVDVIGDGTEEFPIGSLRADAGLIDISMTFGSIITQVTVSAAPGVAWQVHIVLPTIIGFLPDSLIGFGAAVYRLETPIGPAGGTIRMSSTAASASSLYLVKSYTLDNVDFHVIELIGQGEIVDIISDLPPGTYLIEVASPTDTQSQIVVTRN